MVACTGKDRLNAGGQDTHGAHRKHEVHGCDLGRVEAQRLVEGLRFLPSRKERHTKWERRGPGDVGGRVGDGGARGVQGKARLEVGCMARTERTRNI